VPISAQPAVYEAPEASGSGEGSGGEEEEVDAGEQAAVGRLSSMSLMAAVAANSNGEFLEADFSANAFQRADPLFRQH
jgi:hypothetical protein